MIRTACVSLLAASTLAASASTVTFESIFRVTFVDSLFADSQLDNVEVGDEIAFSLSYDSSDTTFGNSPPVTSFITSVPFGTPTDIFSVPGDFASGMMGFFDDFRPGGPDRISTALDFVAPVNPSFFSISFSGGEDLLTTGLPTFDDLDAGLITGGFASLSLPNGPLPGPLFEALTADLVSVVITPAPSAAALLGLGGMLAARRRR
ncbi:MAG: hypothetical protein AAF747_02835 [Planctomycetota bacterium]